MAYDEFKYMKEDYNALISEFGDIEGVKELADEIWSLYDSELYESFFKIFIFNDKHKDHRETELNEEDKKKLKFINFAYENMSRPVFFVFRPMNKIVTFFDFYRMYTFFTDIYEMNTGGKIKYNELKKLAFSKLDERLVFALNRFDEATKTPEPTAEYFQKLNGVKWKDKKTKQLLERLNKLHREIKRKKWGAGKSSIFSVSELKFTRFLAGCSAVNDNRDKINMQDIITAHKTYFKLLKTDLPSLVDRLWEEQDMMLKLTK